MRLYLAGGETWANLLLDLGVKHILFSYFYFRTSLRSNGRAARQLLARLRRAQQRGYSFMLDSGAFTYQTRIDQGRHVPPPGRYFQEYKRFVQDYGDLFDVIAELDIDYVEYEPGKRVSIQQIDDWIDELLLIGGDIQRRIMPVYHENTRGEAWLDGWLSSTDSPLIGYASGNVLGTGGLITKCHRWGKFVHGFGQTRIKTDMKYHNWDSVDSTTWLRADKYGGTCIFRNGKFVVLDHKNKKQRGLYRDYWKSWGLDFKKIMKDDLEEMRKATIIAWRELANDFEKRWHVRNGGKHPYLYGLHAKGIQHVPIEHPLITKAKRDAKRSPPEGS